MFRTRIRPIIVLWLALLWAGLPAAAQAPKTRTLDAAQRAAIISDIASLLNQNYIFPETATAIEHALRDRLAGGAYDKLSDAGEFAQAVSRDLSATGHDKHMGFAYAPDQAAQIRRLQSRSEDEAKAARERQLAAERHDNFGFQKVERLPGNIGYLDFRMFGSASEAAPTMIAALNFLAYCDAIIVDLRQNGGGDTTGIQFMCSYFFDEPAHLNDIRFRDEAKTENYWSLPYVPGPKPSKADLYILTSSRTFSGAEEFSYNMKNLKRGTLVGETTGGGAHPTRPWIVQDDFVLRVPFARAENPVSKTNWEGTGVVPDVAVPADQAFDRAYQMAVEKLAAQTTDPGRKAECEWVLTTLKAKANPVHLDEKTLKSYVGTYGERKVTWEKGNLFYQRTGPKLRLTPLTPTQFAVEGLDYFRVEFTVKDGKSLEIVGLLDNGERDPSPRTR